MVNSSADSTTFTLNSASCLVLCSLFSSIENGLDFRQQMTALVWYCHFDKDIQTIYQPPYKTPFFFGSQSISLPCSRRLILDSLY